MEHLAHLLGICPCRLAHLDLTDLIFALPLVGLFYYKVRGFFKGRKEISKILPSGIDSGPSDR